MPTRHPIYQAIDAALDTTPLTTLAVGGIHPDLLPDDSALPAVRYALITSHPHQRLASDDHATAELQIDIYVHRADAATAWSIDSLIHAALARKDITPSPKPTGYPLSAIRAVTVQRGIPIAEPPYYRVKSQYRLFIDP